MGVRSSLLSKEDLEEYQTLTFLTQQEVLQVSKRFEQLVSNSGASQQGHISKWRLSNRQAIHINELRYNPFREEIVNAFSSEPDGSMTFEDFLDMMSVFSRNAPKSVKVSYAFKIYQGIYQGPRPDNQPRSPDAIDLYDIREIVRRLSGKKFSDVELTSVANAVIQEVDLRNEKKITAEIFEYFLSNIPDFPASFIIPISDGKEDQIVTAPVTVQTLRRTSISKPSRQHRRSRGQQ